MIELLLYMFPHEPMMIAFGAKPTWSLSNINLKYAYGPTRFPAALRSCTLIKKVIDKLGQSSYPRRYQPGIRAEIVLSYDDVRCGAGMQVGT